jgi:acetoacetyl-CoA synthetase
MKSKILWKAKQSQKNISNLFRYEKFLFSKYKFKVAQKYSKLLKWSIDNPKKFWNSIWDFTKVKGFKSQKYEKSNVFFKNKFLKNSKLNFAENLMSKNDDSKAITFINENGIKKIITWRELNRNVYKLVTFFRSIKIKEKDRIAAYLPNLIETVESFIATSAIGSIWSSCSPDFGTNGVIERFSQINPKVLIICDRYFYNGKEINVIKRLPLILNKIKSIKHVIIINYPEKSLLKLNKLKNIKYISWNSIMKINPIRFKFKKFDFEHELAILYSSGTTGKPKCICHRSGGVLLQHLKEHQLHSEIKENDNVFYFTTCGWMMWNWLVTVLASKASIVLFEGFPMYKRSDLLIKLADEEQITLFGVSAKYIDALNKSNVLNKKKYKLKNLKTICSTGSPLSEDGFKFIYKKVKSNVHLASISGGTDIVSCFLLGNIYEPVIAGQIQNKGLGMDVDIFNDHGKPIKNKKGELVCKNPFPTMPLKFWNDKNNTKFKEAYFNKFNNIWHHGDYAEIKKTGGFIIYGRSDTTLNPGGVRLGTSEIYSEVEKFKEIKESIAIGQSWDNDIRIILFVIMNQKYKLNNELIKRIKIQIRANASPRHVPSKIINVKDIPRTKNGKIVELAVKNIIEGNEVKNKEALANPEILDEFKNLSELKY